MARLKSNDFVKLVLTLVVVFCPAIAQAQSDSSYSRDLLTDQAAYQRLLHANRFNLGGAGFVAMIMPEEKAFHVLLYSANKTALFQQLVSQGNPEGQLYGLYGLYLGDSRHFKEAAERLRRDGGPPARWEGFIFLEKGKIRFTDGCVMSHSDRNAIIERMAQGGFDQAFRARSPGASRSARVVIKPLIY